MAAAIFGREPRSRNTRPVGLLGEFCSSAAGSAGEGSGVGGMRRFFWRSISGSAAMPLCLAVFLGVTGIAPEAGARQAGQAGADCPRGRSGYEAYQGGLVFMRFADTRFDASVCYPGTVFRAVENRANGLRFISDDGLAWFQLSHHANERRRSIRELMGEAEQELAARSASITYRRTKDDWFVLSGYLGDRIYYRKTILTNAGAAADTLLINFPEEQKPFYYDIVERMSWSYRSR